MAAESIFISIPSYNDPDLPNTLESIVRQASKEHPLHIAVCEQVTEYGHAWRLGMGTAPPFLTMSYEAYGDALLGVGGARAAIESLYRGEDYVLMIDAHTRFEPDFDRTLIESQGKLPADNALITALMASTSWDNHGQVPVTNFHEFLDGLPYYMPELLRQDGPLFYPSRHVHAGSLFGPAWVDDVPYDPHILFNGEEATLAARLWTAGYNLYHMAMPVMHGFSSPPGRPWDRADWHDHNDTSLRRCRVLLQVEEAAADDPALTDIEHYGMGTVRTFQEWLRWSGFNYAAQTADENWGEWKTDAQLAALGLEKAQVATCTGSGH